MSPSRPMPASPARRNGRSVSQRSFQASQARLPHLLLQPDLPEGHQVLWSQIYGLGADVVVPRLEGAPRDDVDTNAKEFLKILEQADMVQKGGTRFEIHKQIHIATRVSFSGSQQGQISGYVRPWRANIGPAKWPAGRCPTIDRWCRARQPACRPARNMHRVVRRFPRYSASVAVLHDADAAGSA